LAKRKRGILRFESSRDVKAEAKAGSGSGEIFVEAEAKALLKKEYGSELGSIGLFEEPKAEAFFIKHGAGM